MYRLRNRLCRASSGARQLLPVAVGLVILSSCTQDQVADATVNSACSDAAIAILDFRVAYSSLDVNEESIDVIRNSGSELIDGPLRDGFQSLAASMELSEDDLEPSQIFTFRRDAADLARLCLESVSTDRVEDIGASFLTALG